MRRRRHNRPKPKVRPKDTFRVNAQILAQEVFVINENNEKLGAMPTGEALALAQEAELDLVEVSPLATPPVCRIIDHGKLIYEQAKKEQQAKAKQKKVEVKGIRIGFRTDTHDLFFKKTQAEKFMMKGNKVNAEIVLHGREKAMLDKAREQLKVFIASINIPHRYEEGIKKSPRGFSAIIVPE